MGVFSWLVSWRRTPETDYETILARLAKDITDVQTRLTAIRTRERRARVQFTIYAFAAWALYAAACWSLGALTLNPAEREGGDEQNSETGRWATLWAVWMPVLGTPIGIIFTRRIVRWWYKRIGDAEEKHLRELKNKQRSKIDEIKSATKYDRLRLLLEKYDTDAQPRRPAAQQQQQQPQAQAGRRRPEALSTRGGSATPQRQSMPNAAALMRSGAGPTGGPQPPHSTVGLVTPGRNVPASAPAGGIPPATPPPALPRTWMDKLADAVLGSDGGEVGPEQRYALICERCHSHNGLAKREEFDEIQYVCPRCGHFNSRRPSSTPISSPFGSRPSPTSGNAGLPSSASFGGPLGGAGARSPGGEGGLQPPTHPYMLKPDGRAYSQSHSNLAALSSGGHAGDGDDESEAGSFYAGGAGANDSMASLRGGEEQQRTPRPNRERDDDGPPPSSPLVRKGGDDSEGEEGGVLYAGKQPVDMDTPTKSKGARGDLRARRTRSGSGERMDLD